MQLTHAAYVSTFPFIYVWRFVVFTYCMFSNEYLSWTVAFFIFTSRLKFWRLLYYSYPLPICSTVMRTDPEQLPKDRVLLYLLPAWHDILDLSVRIFPSKLIRRDRSKLDLTQSALCKAVFRPNEALGWWAQGSAACWIAPGFLPFSSCNRSAEYFCCSTGAAPWYLRHQAT